MISLKVIFRYDHHDFVIILKVTSDTALWYDICDLSSCKWFWCIGFDHSTEGYKLNTEINDFGLLKLNIKWAKTLNQEILSRVSLYNGKVDEYMEAVMEGKYFTGKTISNALNSMCNTQHSMKTMTRCTNNWKGGDQNFNIHVILHMFIVKI